MLALRALVSYASDLQPSLGGTQGFKSETGGQISLKQLQCTPAPGVTLTIKFLYYSFRKLSCFERVQAWMWMMN